MNNLVSRLLPAFLLGGVLLLVVAVSGCGVSSTTTLGSGSQPSRHVLAGDGEANN